MDYWQSTDHHLGITGLNLFNIIRLIINGYYKIQQQWNLLINHLEI